MEEWAKIPAAVCANLVKNYRKHMISNCKQRFLYQILSSAFLMYQLHELSALIEVYIIAVQTYR
jgi:hypothetical protein